MPAPSAKKLLVLDMGNSKSVNSAWARVYAGEKTLEWRTRQGLQNCAAKARFPLESHYSGLRLDHPASASNGHFRGKPYVQTSVLASEEFATSADAKTRASQADQTWVEAQPASKLPMYCLPIINPTFVFPLGNDLLDAMKVDAQNFEKYFWRALSAEGIQKSIGSLKTNLFQALVKVMWTRFDGTGYNMVSNSGLPFSSPGFDVIEV